VLITFIQSILAISGAFQNICSMQIHIGKKIEEIAKIQGLGATELGKKLNTTRENIYNIYSREMIDTPLLLLCCKALKHDFFQYFYAEEPLASFRKKEIQSWQDKIDNLSERLKLSTELVDTQKELIKTQRDNIKLLKSQEVK